MFKSFLFGKRDRQNSREDYKVFTRDYDREVTGRSLTETVRKVDKKAWLEQIEAYEALTRDIRQERDFGSLARHHLNGPWSQMKPETLSVAVLLDHSGSLRGRPAMISCLLTELISDYLSGLGTPHEILGFTTSSWRGGQAYIKWLGEQCPKHPGRLNELLHIVYREAVDKYPGAPTEIRHILNSALLKENIDGEALLWAADRLEKRDSRTKLILFVSDGVPSDDATMIENDKLYLLRHFKASITEISGKRGIRLACIGIRHDPPDLFDSSIRIDELEQVSERLPDFLQTAIASGAEGDFQAR